MSTIFTGLLVSIFFAKNSAEHGNFNNAFHLPMLLQKVIAALVLWPNEGLDSAEEVQLVRGDTVINYFKTLINVSSDYVD